MNRVYPVILAGGSGERLWPLSRRERPKQFLPILSENTMFVDTLKRVSTGKTILDVQDPLVICASDHAELVLQESREKNIRLKNLILEPVGRNTAAAATVTAILIQNIDPEGVVLLMPADHYIKDVAGYWGAVAKGVRAAGNNKIATLGIEPTRPETGFGYLETGEEVDENTYLISEFLEKPDLQTAVRFIEEGGRFWNSGNFLFKPAVFLGELQKYKPAIYDCCKQAIDFGRRQAESIFLDPDHFHSCESDSIDYAVMEKTDKGVIVAPVSIGWDDIGSWAALKNVCEKDDTTGSSLIGNVLAQDASRVYVRSEGPLVAAIGVEDIVLVATEDVVLVTTAERSQDVKEIVARLKAQKRDQLL